MADHVALDHGRRPRPGRRSRGGAREQRLQGRHRRCPGCRRGGDRGDAPRPGPPGPLRPPRRHRRSRAGSRSSPDIEAREGGLDVLVNNAGIIRVTRLSDIALEEWELLQRVNATSVVLGIQAAAPAITRRGGGSIVNVASTAAHRGAEGYGAYSASKAAVLAMTRAAALELAPNGIRVNAISPGGVETPMNDDEPPGGTSAAAPLGRRRTARGDLAAGRLPRDDGVRLRHRRRLPHRRRGDHPMTEPRIALVTGAASGMGRSTAAGVPRPRLDGAGTGPDGARWAGRAAAALDPDHRRTSGTGAAVDAALAAHVPALGGRHPCGRQRRRDLPTVHARDLHRRAVPPGVRRQRPRRPQRHRGGPALPAPRGRRS